MVRKILIGVSAAVAVFSGVVEARPSACHVERSVVVAASPERVRARIDDFHAWRAWSPYEKVDPSMERTYSGAPSGQGAVYDWSSNGKAGKGRMTIERSDDARVDIRLEFFAPMRMTNASAFTFERVDGGTRVTWSMDGTNTFVSKALHIFVDFDKIVGGDFERGLGDMKSIVEREQ